MQAYYSTAVFGCSWWLVHRKGAGLQNSDAVRQFLFHRRTRAARRFAPAEHRFFKNVISTRARVEIDLVIEAILSLLLAIHNHRAP